MGSTAAIHETSIDTETVRFRVLGRARGRAAFQPGNRLKSVTLDVTFARQGLVTLGASAPLRGGHAKDHEVSETHEPPIHPPRRLRRHPVDK
jgi:hypothetical protein